MGWVAAQTAAACSKAQDPWRMPSSPPEATITLGLSLGVIQAQGIATGRPCDPPHVAVWRLPKALDWAGGGAGRGEGIAQWRGPLAASSVRRKISSQGRGGSLSRGRHHTRRGAPVRVQGDVEGSTRTVWEGGGARGEEGKPPGTSPRRRRGEAKHLTSHRSFFNFDLGRCHSSRWFDVQVGPFFGFCRGGSLFSFSLLVPPPPLPYALSVPWP